MFGCRKKLVRVLWEITRACNAKCIHCYSDSGIYNSGVFGDELVYAVAQQLLDLKCQELTFTGGEFFLYPKWKEVLSFFKNKKIKVSLVTNGLLVSDDILDFLKSVGVYGIGVSLDGAIPKTHDMIRRSPGCFDRVIGALQMAGIKKIPATAITTINRLNITELKELRELLIQKGVKTWQIQHSILSGRMPVDLCLDSFGFYVVGLFYAQSSKLYSTKQLRIITSPSMGYYSRTISETFSRKCWMGCTAGKIDLGIRSNGDIVGCVSFFNNGRVEGNIKKTSLVDIISNRKFCDWNRRLTHFKNLDGFCKKCPYGIVCLGGCPAYTDVQKQCYYALERKWEDSVPQNATDNILKELTQGHFSQKGDFYLRANTLVSLDFINSLDLDDYHKNILKIIALR